MMRFYSSSNWSCFLTFFFFFNDTATTEIYTLSLHDALPIFRVLDHGLVRRGAVGVERGDVAAVRVALRGDAPRSEEHTSELQSRQYLVCRLLLEKKKQDKQTKNAITSKTQHNILTKSN